MWGSAEVDAARCAQSITLLPLPPASSGFALRFWRESMSAKRHPHTSAQAFDSIKTDKKY
jgi:hypothetical protein